MVMRVGGLASGMDIDSIVKQMMTARREPLNKLAQKKQIMEWQRDDYKSMNSLMLDFRNNKLFEFKKDSTFSAKQASVNGQNDILSVKTTASAVSGPIYVGVRELATSTTGAADLSAILKNPKNSDNTPVLDSEENVITDYDPSLPLNKYIQTISAGLEGKVELNINGKTVKFSFDPSVETLDALIYKMNTNSESPVSVYLDASSKKLSVVSKNTGEGTITINDGPTGGNIAANLFYSDIDGDGVRTSILDVTSGKNAKVVINGIDSIRSSNTFTVNGTEITIKGISQLDSSNKPIVSTLNVTTDTTKIVDSIKSFISDYNSMLSGLYGKFNEKYYRDFLPLTSEQKESMKEKEIEQWELKAKSGHLRNDGILSRTYYDMRSIIASQVETGSDKYKTLSSIGIETGQYSENGKLYLKHEDKLLKALQEDPEAVKAIFRAQGDGTDDQNKIGMAERLYKTMYTAISDISAKAGTSKFVSSETFKYNEDSMMGKNLTSLTKQIANWTTRLQDIEDRYYAQFTAMEKAISKYNNQSAYMTNMFSSK